MQANSPEPDFGTSPQAENGANHSNSGTHGYRTFDEYIDDRMKDYYKDDVLYDEQMEYYDYNDPMDGDYEMVEDSEKDPQIDQFDDSKVMGPRSTKGIQCLWANKNNQICGLAFDTSTELTHHIWKEHKMEKGGLVCCWSGCRRKLKPIVKKREALIHLKRHTGETAYKCQTCNAEYFEGWKSTDMQTGGPLKCSKCEKGTVNKILKEQLGQEALSSVRSDLRDYADPGLTVHQKPISHDQELRRNEHSGQAKSPEHLSQEGLPSGRLLALNQGIGLEEHQCLWVTDGEVCLKSFDKLIDLGDHICEVHLERYQSPIFCLWRGCDRNRRPFNRKGNLIRHLRVHTGEKETHEEVFIPKESTCLWVTDGQVCMHKCQTTEIIEHIRLFHTKESKCFECCWQGCEHKKPFESHREGIFHLRTHVGLRSFRCETCHKEYSRDSSLFNHKTKGRGCPGLAQPKKPSTEVFPSPVGYSNLPEQNLGAHYEDPMLEDHEAIHHEQQLPLEDQSMSNNREVLMELEHQQVPHHDQHVLGGPSRPLYSDQVVDDWMRLEEPTSYGNGCTGQGSSHHGAFVEYSKPFEQDLGAHYEGPGLEDQEAIHNNQQPSLEHQSTGNNRKVLLELDHQQAPHYEQHFLEAFSAPLYSKQVIDDRIRLEKPSTGSVISDSLAPRFKRPIAPLSKSDGFYEPVHKRTYQSDFDYDDLVDENNPVRKSNQIQCLWNLNGQLCLQTSQTPKELQDHVRLIHSNRQPYICLWKDCKRKLRPYLNKKPLLSHLQGHTGNKLFKRGPCKEVFWDSDSLSAHKQEAHTVRNGMDLRVPLDAPVEYSNPSAQDLGAHRENPGLEDQEFGDIVDDGSHCQQLPQEEQPSYGFLGQRSSGAPVEEYNNLLEQQYYGAYYKYPGHQQPLLENQPIGYMEQEYYQNSRTSIPFGQVYYNWSNIPQWEDNYKIDE